MTLQLPAPPAGKTAQTFFAALNGDDANSGINSNMKFFADGSYTVIVTSNYDASGAEDLNYEITRLPAR